MVYRTVSPAPAWKCECMYVAVNESVSIPYVTLCLTWIVFGRVCVHTHKYIYTPAKCFVVLMQDISPV